MLFYNGRGTAEQWIKEGKYGPRLDAALVSQLRCQPGEAVAVHTRLQPSASSDKVFGKRASKFNAIVWPPPDRRGGFVTRPFRDGVGYTVRSGKGRFETCPYIRPGTGLTKNVP